ncbi:MAG: ribosome maturation factor RimP [Acidimicrobiales bacterium]|jgi:ribosome maturation factor RimP|nr:ribosome maturation factor RimP [Acidimicrobiales bacterium]
MDAATRVRLLVVPVVEAAGASLYDLEHTGGVLRITVDRPGGVDLELIGRLTREISRLLDDEDPIAGQYTLEVSSPGLERPLRRPEHWVGAVGTLVNVKTRAGVEGDRRIKGVVQRVDASTVTIALEPSGEAAELGATRVLDLADIERARTVFEWGPAPKPGSRPSGAAKGSGASPKPKSSEKKAAKP